MHKTSIEKNVKSLLCDKNMNGKYHMFFMKRNSKNKKIIKKYSANKYIKPNQRNKI